jgi:hypothetical protein
VLSKKLGSISPSQHIVVSHYGIPMVSNQELVLNKLIGELKDPENIDVKMPLKDANTSDITRMLKKHFKESEATPNVALVCFRDEIGTLNISAE